MLINQILYLENQNSFLHHTAPSNRSSYFRSPHPTIFLFDYFYVAVTFVTCQLSFTLVKQHSASAIRQSWFDSAFTTTPSTTHQRLPPFLLFSSFFTDFSQFSRFFNQSCLVAETIAESTWVIFLPTFAPRISKTCFISSAKSRL